MGKSIGKSIEAIITIVLVGLTVFAALFGAWFWIGTSGQPLVDQHDFRQTQTALSSFWLFRDGTGLLNYQTPVLGYPWSIPFEFPLFQLLARSIHTLTGLELAASGRLLSSLFGLASLAAGIGILRLFSISKAGILAFVLLYLLCPIYLYWNRTFMIESMALFFSLLSLTAYWKARLDPDAGLPARLWMQGGSFAALVLALLIKATTALPPFLLMTADTTWLLLASTGVLVGPNRTLTARRSAWLGSTTALCLVAAFLALRVWTHHADDLKALSPFGVGMTSQALAGWNFGTLAQRMSADLWQKVLLGRMLTPWGAVPIAMLLALALGSGWGTKQDKILRRDKTLILWLLFLALTPLLIFTNLHIVHRYYQSANQVYLLMAIGAALSLLFRQGRILPLACLAIVVMICIGFITTFQRDYYWAAHLTVNDRLLVGNRIRARTAPDQAIIVFGDDWSSAIPFHAQRKALAYPEWGEARTGITQTAVLEETERFLGDRRLGVVVSSEPISPDLLAKACPQGRAVETIEKWRIYDCRP